MYQLSSGFHLNQGHNGETFHSQNSLQSADEEEWKKNEDKKSSKQDPLDLPTLSLYVEVHLCKKISFTAKYVRKNCIKDISYCIDLEERVQIYSKYCSKNSRESSQYAPDS